MPVIGVNFDKLLVEKIKPLELPLKVNTNLEIRDINKDELKFSAKEDSVLRVNFEFSLTYNPKIADLSVKGHLHFLDKKEAAEELLKTWKKDKKLKGEQSRAILNAILLKCHPKALAMTQEVNLPPHLEIPLLAQRKR